VEGLSRRPGLDGHSRREGILRALQYQFTLPPGQLPEDLLEVAVDLREAGHEGLFLHLVVLVQLLYDRLPLCRQGVPPLGEGVMPDLDMVILPDGQHIHRLHIPHSLLQGPDLLRHDLGVGRLLVGVNPAALDLTPQLHHSGEHRPFCRGGGILAGLDPIPLPLCLFRLLLQGQGPL